MIALALVPIATAVAQPLPPVPVPPQNPITEAKRVLGKILFWEAQLSSDNSISCGTCHIPADGGVDARPGRNPGFDGNFFTADDVFGSPGVIRSSEDGAFTPDETFALQVQVTGRAAVSSIMAAYARDLFWDGRAMDEFVDPETGDTIIPVGGGLESQAVGPIMSDVEMAHENRDWDNVRTRLQTAYPLALATDVPPDMADAIAADPSYADLFAAAFGDDDINAARIGMAIATYERTLIPDETPWDLGTMTPQQNRGWNVFRNARCAQCHTPPFFTDHSFRNVGLRPVEEDRGRQDVTNNPQDRGRFKVPSLRSVGVQDRFMHNGFINNIDGVLDFYARRGFQSFQDNRDPLLSQPIPFDPLQQNDVVEFLRGGLLDPRVANETFPFDRPTLHHDLVANPGTVAPGIGGTGGFVPEMLAPGTPNLGNDTFRFGIAGALAGVDAVLSVYRTMNDALDDTNAVEVHGPMPLLGNGPGNGFGTVDWPIGDADRLLGDEAYAVWRVDDKGAGGRARSDVVRVTFYRIDPTSCGCEGDLYCNGRVGYNDLIRLLSNWGACDMCGADLDDNGLVELSDLILLLARWGDC